MSELVDQVLSCVQATAGKMTDSDQRSAIGMARTWVEKRETFVPTQVREFQSRDLLASKLISILSESAAEPDDMINALAKARTVINAPYRRGEFVGTAPAKEWKKPRVEASRNGQQ